MGWISAAAADVPSWIVDIDYSDRTDCHKTATLTGYFYTEMTVNHMEYWFSEQRTEMRLDLVGFRRRRGGKKIPPFALHGSFICFISLISLAANRTIIELQYSINTWWLRQSGVAIIFDTLFATAAGCLKSAKSDGFYSRFVRLPFDKRHNDQRSIFPHLQRSSA